MALRLLLATAAVALCVLSPAATDARPALRAGSVASPAWSPDGRSILWSQLVPHVGDEIWIAHRDMSHAHRVTGAIDALGKITWLSRRRLVYEANFRLFTFDLRTRRSTLISPAAGITFVVDRRGDRIAAGDPPCSTGCSGPIRVLDTRGHLVANVGGTRAQNMSPSFSPGGRRLVFDRNVCTDDGRCDTATGIWTASIATGALRRVTRTGVCPDWSPDGRSIVYVDGFGGELRVASIGGGGSIGLGPTLTCNLDFPPSWSPNSRDVAAVDSRAELEIIDVRTRSVRLKTALTVGTVTNFAWSPDSAQLLVVGRRGLGGCGDLWLVTVETAAARRLRRCG